jgi:TolB-like protein
MSEQQAIPKDRVQDELERVLSSRGFVNAGRLSRLLRHSVEKTLAGQADELKEYSVGMEVFDRDDKYDPRVDSIVRVEAGRLRSRLEEYYGAEGASDPVRISLPRGAYVAQFELRTDPPAVEVAEPASAAPATASSSPRRRWAPWVAVAILAGLGIAMIWLPNRAAPDQGSPSVAVLAFEQYSASEEDGAVAAQLTDSVTAELARLGTVSVVSHTSAMQFAGERRPLKEIAGALNANFIVEGSIENLAGGIRVMARVVNASTDRKIWVEDFAGRPDDIRTLSRNIASGVSTALLSARHLTPAAAPAPKHQAP